MLNKVCFKSLRADSAPPLLKCICVFDLIYFQKNFSLSIRNIKITNSQLK